MTLINVTQDLIDAGAACSCMSCPINLAAELATGMPCATHRDFINVMVVQGPMKRVPLPQSAIDFIATFDSSLEGRKKVLPFTFELDI